MADYIDRKAAIKLLTSVGLEVSDGKRRTVAKCINEIELMPAADVAPVRHGRWIDHKAGEQNRVNVYIECSECNTWYCYAKTNYCPNCGAQMEGEVIQKIEEEEKDD